MKMQIKIENENKTNNDEFVIDILIVAKNSCSKRLFQVDCRKFLRGNKHIRTLSNRISMFPEYKLMRKNEPKINYGGDILKDYTEQFHYIVDSCFPLEDQRNKLKNLRTIFDKKTGLMWWRLDFSVKRYNIRGSIKFDNQGWWPDED